jgi:hypothetical protein
MPAKIFISYRRDDDPSAAARVRDGLIPEFGQSNLFIDVDNLRAGQRFEDELANALAACDVLIAIIGQRWMRLLKTKSAGGERDYAREEIAGALQRKIAVVPVRVGRGDHLPALPRARDLPEDIRELVLHQKHDVTHEHFGRDIAELSEAIKGVRGLTNTVKLFLTTLSIVCGTAAALFAISFALSSAFWGDSEAAFKLASALAALPIAGFPRFLEVIEQRDSRKRFSAGKPSPIYNLSGFRIKWSLMALYGCFLLISVDLVSLFPAALVDDYIVQNFPDIEKPVRNACWIGLILSTNWPAMILCAYLVGRWIGTRCSGKGVIAVLLAIVISLAVWRVVDLFTSGEEEFTPSELVLDLCRFPLLICAGLIGYLHYVLGALPAETRDTIIDLAFEEAQKVGPPKGLPAG